MEEQEYKFTAKVQDKAKGKVTEEVNCVLTKSDLVIEAEQPMRIPIARIHDRQLSVGAEYGAQVRPPGTMTLTYFDDQNRKQQLSLEMTAGEVVLVNENLRSTIPKAQKKIWESLPIEMRCAGFGIRFVAYFIDAVILGVIGWILILIFGLALAGGYIVWIIDIVYIIGFWTWRGQTPGKMAAGVKIVKTDESPIGFGRAIVRCIGWWVSVLTLSIVFLWIIWDSRKQGLHDKIAGTYVVVRRP